MKKQTPTKLSRFLKSLKRTDLGAFIVTNPINILYLAGFRGISQTEREAILVFSPKPTLITARLYQSEARKVVSKNLKVKIIPERDQIFSFAKKLISGKKRVGFEENNLRVTEYNLFKKDSLRSQLIPFSNLVESLRIIKTIDEIKKIEKAQIISQKAFESLLKTLKVGQTEDEISERLSKIIKSLGGQGLSFESIIASGPNASMPHHSTGKRKIKKGQVLLLDFGAKFQNYHADLSRTIFIGKANNEQKNVYTHVKKAQAAAIEKIEKGIESSTAFHNANNYFKKHKLEKYFIHGLGHGIGLEIHEDPYLRAKTHELLDNNMVFSVEPGLYFPWGGIRIEDLIVIKNGKAQVLGKTSDDIIEITV